MATYVTDACFLDSLLMFAVLTAFSVTQNISGITANLYQRDVFYNPTLSQMEIIRQAVAWSVWRANMSNSITPNSPVAELAGHPNEYLMKICLGTPPVDIIAVADTGSDLTWTQCQLCTRFIFSCGIDNGGPSDGVGSWVIGLGAGPRSIVTQLGQLSRRKFSYCLIPLSLQGQTSHIHFGDDAAVHRPRTVKISLARGQHRAFTTARIPFIGYYGTVEEGNIVIDSGSTIMSLPRHFYAQIKLTVTMRPWDGVLELCYRRDHQSLQLPSIVANFRGGDVPLKRYNAFVTAGPVTCLAIVAIEKVTVYGNVAQQDFLIGFDKMFERCRSSPSTAPIPRGCVT
uniref:Peptidase A1 domain-containing protein n=1 Tax=Kalanchoe fedtschenkoi TaxID=63787 RepID=A0A7N0VK79_KALFE